MYAIAAQQPRKESHIIISIRTPGAQPANFPRGPETRAVLFCEFHDLDERYRAHLIGSKDAGMMMGSTDAALLDVKEAALFSPEDARRILAFFKLHRQDVETTVVQCEGGMSRSAGVAAALAKICGEDDTTFFRSKTPNMLVYRTLLQEHYGKT